MINILVTLDAKYIPPLKVLLNSMFLNNKDEKFTIYLLHSSLTQSDLDHIQDFVASFGHTFHPIFVADHYFRDAPVLRHYTKEMYYRLAAHKFLPESVDRILYLDPDIIVLNPIREFYEMDFEGNLFIAAEHEFTARIALPFNRLRLKVPQAKGYFNTGVLLMNVKLMRELVHMDDIYEFIEENKLLLLLPDQDVMNGLYWDKIKKVDSFRYNYDARYYDRMKLIPNIKYNDINWIEKNTVFLHYCGKDKPWNPGYKGDLGAYYHKYNPENDAAELVE